MIRKLIRDISRRSARRAPIGFMATRKKGVSTTKLRTQKRAVSRRSNTSRYV